MWSKCLLETPGNLLEIIYAGLLDTLQNDVGPTSTKDVGPTWQTTSALRLADEFVLTGGIAIPRYLAEVERLLHLGTHSVIPRNQNALSLGGKIFGVHLLNAFRLATIDIVRYLEGVRPGCVYSWEPAAAVPTGNVDVNTAADEESTELYDLGEALQGGPPRAPPPPPPASNCEAIVQLVRISGGPVASVPYGTRWGVL